MTTAPTRLPCLDVLRAVAVLLVIGRHVDFQSPIPAPLSAWQRGGWVGVDLFFVLSGFLVSGLLFQEYVRRGTVNLGRFLIRRGLKIYPAFYFFLVVTVVVMGLQGSWPDARGLVGEVLFVQNYLGGVWNHTWSLAIEEHFYLGIALLVTVLLRQRVDKPLAALPRILIVLAVVLLGLRIVKADAGWWALLKPTHLRIDALGFGVLLSYLWHFHNPQITALFRRFRAPALIAGIGLVLPAFVWPLETTPAIYTVGFTGFYLGSGLILMGLLVGRFPDNLLVRATGQVGAHSYSIYLWHMPVIVWLVPAVTGLLGTSDPWLSLLSAVCGSVACGMLMARIVEFPVLRLRDRFFPSKTAAAGGLADAESNRSAKPQAAVQAI
jgi:peptidoglycan/LPS O-acetylase OafA/YrhL